MLCAIFMFNTNRNQINRALPLDPSSETHVFLLLLPLFYTIWPVPPPAALWCKEPGSVCEYCSRQVKRVTLCDGPGEQSLRKYWSAKTFELLEEEQCRNPTESLILAAVTRWEKACDKATIVWM